MGRKISDKKIRVALDRSNLKDVERVIGLFEKKPFAACVSKSRARNPVYDLTIIVDDSKQGVERTRRHLRGNEYVVTLVSRNLFERDVKRGALGEFVAAILLEPYMPVYNGEYLSDKETELKIRVIKEELENLSLRYQDLLSEILIDPRFFFHVKMTRRAKIYPPLRSSYLRHLLEEGTESHHGYGRALEDLVKSGLLTANHYVRVTKKLIDELPKPGEKVFTPFREVDLAIRRLATYGMASNALEPTLIDDLYHDIDFASVDGFEDLPDPKAYLFLPTDRGLISLDDKRGYRELIKSSNLPPGSIRRIGGALNFVYLIEYEERGNQKKVVAKTYQNWYGLKWIPLSIWTVGSQNFDIIGERRMTNEYRMNRSLRSNGLNAPEIYHVSVPKRTIIEEFIPGTAFDVIAKKCLDSNNEYGLTNIKNLGEEISRVHALGISLGDSKPDNAILDASGRIWFVDLEQASEIGTPAWDLAEFLYYCGHYTLRWGRMKPLVEAFLDGYIRLGDKRAVREISSSKYKRIFGVLTAPHIVMGISKVSRSYGMPS